MDDAGSRPLRVAVVRGRSMLPALRDGDRLLIRQGRVPRVGDVVVARLVDGTVVVKRVTEQRERGWWLLSDNAAEGRGDSRAYGAVAPHDVLGVALVRLWPRPRRLVRRV